MALCSLKFSKTYSFGGLLLLVVLHWVLPSSDGRGLMLLYRPRDVTGECALSENLRYDLSFGMGMSDTITLVFRTLAEIDYECGVDIGVEKDIFLLIVIRFPSPIDYICKHNPYAFVILKKETCINLCDSMPDKPKTEFFAVPLKSRFRFRFVSNSSINADIQANLYEVTATTARRITHTPRGVCDRMNETTCVMSDEVFCFTSGVACDGIKNCGQPAWFDKRKSDCELPSDAIGRRPVLAMMLALVCALLAAVHITIKCLPPSANSYFVFNINEDNRLCIDPVFRIAGGSELSSERVKRLSIIPVDNSSSSSNSVPIKDASEKSVSAFEEVSDNSPHKKKNTMKIVTQMIQEKFKFVASRNKNASASDSNLNTSSHTKAKSFIA